MQSQAPNNNPPKKQAASKAVKLVAQNPNLITLDKNLSTWFDQESVTDRVLEALSKIDFSVFAYQGFDPERTLRRICECQNASKDHQDKMFTDVFECNYIVGVRGTDIDSVQMTEKSTEEFVLELERLKAKYYLKKNAEGASPDDLTLARIAAVTPEYMALVLCTGMARLPYKHKDLPLIYHFPGAIAIMGPKAWAEYGDEYKEYMLEFTKVISRNNQKIKNLGEDQLKTRQEGIITSQRTSPYNNKRYASLAKRIDRMHDVAKAIALDKVFFEKHYARLMMSLSNDVPPPDDQ